MSHHRLQRNRFEYKFLIDERTAHEVRTFARSYLVRDEHAQRELDWSYPTHSVYLDGPGLPLYRSTLEGHRNRFKLRVRYYSEAPDQPVYFEIKRRVNDVILKERGKVRRDRAVELLRGRPPGREDLVDAADFQGWEALGRFWELRDQIQATPRVYVSYLREAWVREGDDAVRLTFDRKLCGGAYAGGFEVKREVWPPPLVPNATVILELKFSDRYPHWFGEMCRALSLERRKMAKYCITTYWLPRQGRREASGEAGMGEVLNYD